MNVRAAVFATVCGAVLLACGGAGTETTAPPPPVDNTPASVKLTPASAVTVQSGATTTISASVLNAAGSTVSATVSWSSSDTTIASVSGGVVTGVKVGAVTVTATAGTVSATLNVTVTAGAAAQLVVRTQPAGASSGVALATQPVIELRDAAGNLSSSATNQVTVSIASGGGTLMGTTTVTAVAGVATFTDLVIAGTIGSRTLSFASGTLAVTSSVVSLTPGLPASLAIRTQPAGASSGLALTTQPVIELHDAVGNVVTGSTASVTASIASGGGTLSGTTTVAASAGVATFTDLAMAGTIGGRTMIFVSGSLAVTSSSISLAAGSAAVLAIRTQPGVAFLSSAFPVQPVVEIRDASGNLVTTSTASVTAAIASGGGLLGGAATVAASGGVATFTGLFIAGTSALRTLSFASTGLASVASAQFGVYAPHVVGYGVASEKVKMLDIGGTFAPTTSVKDSSGAVVSGVSLRFAARATSIATVGADGTITARAGGATWVIGTSSLSSDSVYVSVPLSATAPMLRTNLTSWHTVTDGTVQDTVFLDTRSATVGGASVALTFQFFTADTIYTSGKCTYTVNAVSGTGYSVVVGSSYRATIASASGVTGPTPLVTVSFNTCESKTAAWLVLTPLDVNAVDGSSFASLMLPARVPMVITP